MNFVQWVTVIVYSLASVKNYIYKILHSLSPHYSKYDLLSHNISNMHFLKNTHTPQNNKKKYQPQKRHRSPGEQILAILLEHMDTQVCN